MTIGSLLVLLLAVLGIWYFLDRREKARLANGHLRHSGLRLIFASFAILTVLFSGGCGGLFLFSWIADGMSSNNYIGWGGHRRIVIAAVAGWAAHLVAGDATQG